MFFFQVIRALKGTVNGCDGLGNEGAGCYGVAGLVIVMVTCGQQY